LVVGEDSATRASATGVNVNVLLDEVGVGVAVVVAVKADVGVAVGGVPAVAWITSCGRLLLASRLLKFILEALVVVSTRS
jgi:hypothetical protein